MSEQASAPQPQGAAQAPEVAAQVPGQTGAQGAAAQYSSSTIIHNLGELKQKAPELYEQMQRSLAQNMISQSSKFTKRLKEIREREEEQNKKR